MTCPTVNAIKRAWRSLIGQPPGYGPLALDNSHSAKVRTASTSSSTWFLFTSSPSESELDSDPDSDSDSDATVVMDVNREDGGKQYRAIGAEKLSSFPRPKTILLTSLCIWTGLMVLSSSMGFNTPENQTPHTMNQLEQQGMQEGLFATDDREPMHNDEAQLRNIVVSWLETDSEGRKETEFAAWKADQDEVQEREEEPYATIKTNILILNKRVETAENQEGSINNAEVLISEDDEDFFLAQDEDAVDAMTMDLEDSAVFLNFLRQLEAEDQAARTTEEIQEQTQQQKQELVIKTTDELTVNSMIESQLPCGYNSKENAISNTWITEIMPEFIHRFLTRAEDVDGSETRQTGKAFVYHAWWTDLMILAVAMCLGGVLVGLAQSREVCEQLLERQRRQLSFLHEKSHPNRQRHIGASALSIVLSLVISASAMILTILMILAECWDVPSIYFSGIGIAGIILVHALIPDLQVDFLDSWEDDSEDSDGFDDEKSVSSMRGSWSPPMMERPSFVL
ncbi:hypothetical protein BGX28_001954 [Mortierella sp. GBA30]|nr:hypothetical protein BGX28_001954 [Mortierella sp. GBA30]